MPLELRMVEGSSSAMSAALALRREVFVVEQFVPEELETDAFDAVATHVGAFLDTELVGTLRILERGAAVKVGRVAVRRDRRGVGIGARLMQFATAYARERGFSEVRVDAQLAVVEFYRKLGFVAEGEVFEEAGIAHRHMRLSLR